MKLVPKNFEPARLSEIPNGPFRTTHINDDDHIIYVKTEEGIFNGVTGLRSFKFDDENQLVIPLRVLPFS